ncbi:hypothetical protein RR48_04905 [Papilio machaon]|uniref:Uncharacterized protein n=1 Tax=Papilio machaon TaxID=76193 RepID=A0A0N0PF33_PAPMA|nr:hypothetical protein RR48_04905 [Papilio machaon]
MILKVAPVQQTDLREKHCGDEGNLRQLFEAALYSELVSLLLRHERHDAAHIGPGAKDPHSRLPDPPGTGLTGPVWYGPSRTGFWYALAQALHFTCVSRKRTCK